MFGKLLFIVLSCGLTGAALLVLRQQRIEAAHEMSALHQQMLVSERSLWSLRADIADRCRPEEVRRLMMPMPFEWMTMIETPAAGPPAPAAPPSPVAAPASPRPPVGPAAAPPVLSTAAADDGEPYGG